MACEEMLTDAADELLSDADQAWFDRHIAGCIECSAALADARRGAAWLELLKTPRPEPSAQLLERILAQTSGAEVAMSMPAAASAAAVQRLAPAIMPPTNVLPFRPRVMQNPQWHRIGRIMLEPRLAMTAAMAFFSIALTMSLTGVRVSQMRASNLKPASLKRSYYQATASAARRYESFRVVHVLESRDLRDSVRDADDRPGAAGRLPESRRDESRRDQPQQGTSPAGPATESEPKQEPSAPHGVSRNETALPERRFQLTQWAQPKTDSPDPAGDGSWPVRRQNDFVRKDKGGLA